MDHARDAPGANAGRRPSETTTTSSAARQQPLRGGAAVGRRPRRGGWRARGGRRGPRASRAAAAAITVAFALCAWTTCGRKARMNAASRAVHSSDPERGAPALGQHQPRHAPSAARRRAGRPRRRRRRRARARADPPRGCRPRVRRLRGPCPGLRAGSSRARRLQSVPGVPTTRCRWSLPPHRPRPARGRRAARGRVRGARLGHAGPGRASLRRSRLDARAHRLHARRDGVGPRHDLVRRSAYALDAATAAAHPDWVLKDAYGYPALSRHRASPPTSATPRTAPGGSAR